MIHSLGMGTPSMADEIKEEPVTQAELIGDRNPILPGDTFRIGLKLKIPAGSHVYWRNPGEIGTPLKISWSLPDGFKLKNEYWPTPKICEEFGMVFFVYEDATLILADIEAPEEGFSPSSSIKAKVEWVSCGDACVPGGADLELSVSSDGERVFLDSSSDLGALISEYTQDIAEAVAHVKGNELIINTSEENNRLVAKAWFISEGSDNLFAFADECVENASGTSWKFKVEQLPTAFADHELNGILVLTDQGGQKVATYHVRKEEAQPKIAVPNFISILFMAFLGGMLLNIMPCVLPLITLKVYSLMKAAKEQKSLAIVNSLWFTCGVVGCFLGLAGVAALLKIFGHQIGWGFQLQEPLFVSILIIIFFLFGLSSLGLFETGSILSGLGGKLSLTHREGHSKKAISSVCNGVLATLVTTPCTGPFLGSVLGLGMTLPFIFQAMIFACIGLGMAFPYVLFACFPRLMVFLPKPGNWMVVFKQIMGFMLLATVIWLIWIFAAETSAMSVVLLLIGLWLCSVGAWILGQWGTPVSPKYQRIVVFCIFISTILSAIYLNSLATQNQWCVYQVAQDQQADWIPFSSETFEKFRKEKKGIFVNFTATWCLTCQVNKPVLRDRAVIEKFKERGIVLLEADWTKKDPEITRELARLGRASVPSYVYYPADSGAEPIILPEKLSTSVLETWIFSR